MKKGIIFTLFLIGCLTVSAQNYFTGIGIRGGFSQGISVKQFLSNELAAEVLLTTRWKGFGITALAEKHRPISGSDQFYWFLGGGAHVGFWNGRNVSWADDNSGHAVVGLDGIIGVEYQFQIVPFSLGADWKPAINLIGYTGFWADQSAISLRYTF